MIDNLPILFNQDETYSSEYCENECAKECSDYMKCLLMDNSLLFQ